MNAIAPIGHNNPPLSPYEACVAHIEDLLTEARNWADGAEVENQAQADEIGRLLEELRLAEKAADDARKAENKPFDDGKAEVQARYNVYIAPLTNKEPGKIPRAAAALKAALKPFLDRLEAERREREAEARRVAEEAARKAAEAMQTAKASDLGAWEEAEAKLSAAAAMEAEANRIAKERAQSQGGSRALGLKKTYTPVLEDGVVAARHYWATQREACEAFFLSLAQTDVREGKRQIPGFRIEEGTRL